MQRDAASSVPSASNSSAAQKTTRRLRCTTRPSARSVPGCRGTHELDVEIRGEEVLVDGHQRPAGAAHRGVQQRRTPCRRGRSAPDGPWKQNSGVASHSMVMLPVAVLDGAVAERQPDVRSLRRLLAPAGARARHRGPIIGAGHAGEAVRLDPVHLDDPGAAGLLVVQRAERGLRDERRLHQRRHEAADLLRDDRRVRERGAERVDPDPARGELRRGRADEPDDRVLRRRVHRVERRRDEPGERRGRDDRAAVRHQPRGELAHAEDDAVDVDAHDPPVLLVGHLCHVSRRRSRCRR